MSIVNTKWRHLGGMGQTEGTVNVLHLPFIIPGRGVTDRNYAEHQSLIGDTSNEDPPPPLIQLELCSALKTVSLEGYSQSFWFATVNLFAGLSLQPRLHLCQLRC